MDGKSLLISALSMGTLMLVASPAYGGRSVDQRLQNQQRRIDQGVASGALTSQEAQRVQAQHNRIVASVNADRERNGGRLTPAERHRLNERLDGSSKNLWRKKHNAQAR